MANNKQTGKKEVLFDASHAKETPPKSRPMSEQGDRESQKLWAKVTEAIKKRDQNVATDEKSRIEDMQRAEAAERGEHAEWQPKLFRKAKGAAGGGGPGDEDGEDSLDWVIDAAVFVHPFKHITPRLTLTSNGKTPQEISEQILNIAAILPGQKASSVQTGAPQAAPSSAPIPQQEQQTVPHGSSDLVDFGQHGGPSAQPPPQQSSGGGLNNMNDLREPLQPTIHRQDSIEGTEDTFVDADS